MIKWSNPGKEVAAFPKPWCSSYWKGSFLVTLDYGRQLEKVVAATLLSLRRRLSLKGPAEVCGLHIYPLVVYRLSMLPIPCTIISKLERILFHLIWAKKAPLLQRKICCLYLCEGSLGMPNVETWSHTLHLSFLDRMCWQDNATGSSLKVDAKIYFSSLRSMHSADGETHR